MLVLNRRQLLKRAVVAAAVGTPAASAQTAPLKIAGSEAELRIASVSAITVRISVLQVANGTEIPPSFDDSLVQQSWGPPEVKMRTLTRMQSTRIGQLRVSVEPDPLTVVVWNVRGQAVQRLRIDPATGGVSFPTGDSPLLGLGEGGPQFDRRGSTDRMRTGQGGYQPRTPAGPVRIPWVIGTHGPGGARALFFRAPLAACAFTGRAID